MTDMERDRFRMLMMKALDGELAGSEHSEFEQYLRTPENLQEWQGFSTIQEATMSLKRKSLNPEAWDGYWNGVYNRLERGIAWLLMTVGALVLLGWGAIEALASLWQDAALPLVVKLGVIAVCAGLFLLLFSVVRERYFTAKTDKYKGVIR
jgi:hypothetical protein